MILVQQNKNINNRMYKLMNSPHQRVTSPELHQQTVPQSLLPLWSVPQLCWHQDEDKQLHLGAEPTALTLLENNNVANTISNHGLKSVVDMPICVLKREDLCVFT